MVRTLSLALFLCALRAAATDVKGFPPTTLNAFEPRFPTESTADRLVSPVPGISIRAQSTGDFRKLAPDTRDFLSRYEAKYGYTLRTSDLPTLYPEEALVVDGSGGHQQWLAVPTSLSQRFHQQAKVGTSFVFLLRYLGAHGDSRIYIMIDFHKVKTDLRIFREANAPARKKGPSSVNRDPASTKPLSPVGALLNQFGGASPLPPSPTPRMKTEVPSP